MHIPQRRERRVRATMAYRRKATRRIRYQRFRVYRPIERRSAFLHASYNRSRTVGFPPPLRGSLASLIRQNERTKADGLKRIENESELRSRIASKALVPLPVSKDLTVNSSLPTDFRYCRPWTAYFLSNLARAYAERFHQPIEVNSAVRTVEYQEHLMRINGNAAPAEGDIASPHLTGAAVDIAKKGLSRREIGWMRSRLLQIEEEGEIDVEEEFRQACFHITVYKSYLLANLSSSPQWSTSLVNISMRK